MRHWVCIFLFLLLAATGISQETRIVDSLQEVYATQEGREKVLTMIELTWDFYDVSFDDCIIWGEKAVKEANALGLYDLEAKANYVLGIQYAHHADLDLAKDYLRRSYALNEALADTANMFEALWSMATYELVLGSIDSSNMLYDNALTIAEQMNDSLSCVYIYANLAIINYQKNNFIAALDYYYQVVKITPWRFKPLAILPQSTLKLANPWKRRRYLLESFRNLKPRKTIISCKTLAKTSGHSIPIKW